MTEELIVEFSFAIDDPNLEDEDKQKQAIKLLRELREIDAIETVDRTEDINPEAGSKPGIANLVGWLTATVKSKNVQQFLGWLGDRLQDKPAKIIIKIDNQEVIVEAKTRQQLLEGGKIAEGLIDRLKQKPKETHL